MMHGRPALRKPLHPANKYNVDVPFASLDGGSGARRYQIVRHSHRRIFTRSVR